jgi:dUTP pyrophosphatase
MNQFNCWKCGACCKFCDRVEELKHFDRGDGVCVNLLPDNSCAIYESRPEICNTKRMYEKRYKSILDWDTYLTYSEKVCKMLDREVHAMQVKFKLEHKDAKLPSYAKDGDAGLDLIAVNFIETEDYLEYDTGIAVEIPYGHVGLLFPRSSLSKYDLTMCNHVGVVDSGYRGTIKVRFKKTKNSPKMYITGDKICQLVIVPYPKIIPIESNELSNSSRGTGGFGSSGN